MGRAGWQAHGMKFTYHDVLRAPHCGDNLPFTMPIALVAIYNKGIDMTYSECTALCAVHGQEQPTWHAPV